MARKKFQIIVDFKTQKGNTGKLETVVNSKRAVDVQMKANRDWLTRKGHTVTNVSVTEVV